MDVVMCTHYYKTRRNEFFGEDGHKVLIGRLKRLITPLEDSVSIDVGACVGAYIENIRHLSGEVLAFEPNPVNTERFKQRYSDADKVYLYECAISDEIGVMPLFNEGAENNEGNEVASLRGSGAKICDIPVRRLDEVLNEHFEGAVPTINFLKVDTEGNDTRVIKGLGPLISKVKYIIFECSNCLDDHRGPGTKEPMKDIVDYLSQNGFHTYRIGTKKMIRVNDEFWDPTYERIKFWSNCFACRKDDQIIGQLVNSRFDYKGGL